MMCKVTTIAKRPVFWICFYSFCVSLYLCLIMRSNDKLLRQLQLRDEELSSTKEQLKIQKEDSLRVSSDKEAECLELQKRIEQKSAELADYRGVVAEYRRNLEKVTGELTRVKAELLAKQVAIDAMNKASQERTTQAKDNAEALDSARIAKVLRDAKEWEKQLDHALELYPVELELAERLGSSSSFASCEATEKSILRYTSKLAEMYTQAGDAEKLKKLLSRIGRLRWWKSYDTWLEIKQQYTR